MCDCIKVSFGSYDNIKALKNPFYPDNSAYEIIGIDNCIADEIEFLWGENIQTIASCCGHNKINGDIAVIEEDADKMYKLGYVEMKGHNNTFYAKSVSKVRKFDI
jgi:hypothetical protein